jgi:hypothetical protein
MRIAGEIIGCVLIGCAVFDTVVDHDNFRIAGAWIVVNLYVLYRFIKA